MNKILAIILILLILYISGKRGIKLLFSFLINFVLLIIIFYLITLGFNPIIIAILGCILISYIILFMVNGDNIKTRSSMKSIFIILIILTVLIIVISNLAKLGGFGFESYEEIYMYSENININMTNILTSIIIIGLIGAILDTSIAISTAITEVYENNLKLSKEQLYKSGIKIGHDILGTTTNTLTFAFFGEFMTLILWFSKLNYSFIQIINTKVFAIELIKILFSAIGCFLIIPITSKITSNNLKRKI